MSDDNTLYSDDEIIPFPEIGDRLFVTEQNSHHNAQVNYIHSWDTFNRYVLGYKEAADRLARSLLEDHHHLDLVVFPLVFLYRQYLELRLKQILVEGNLLLDKRFTLPIHHIDRLWSECKSLLKQIEPTMEDQEVAALEMCILEFSTIDPSSMAFRYHVDLHDNPSLPPDLRYINIHNLAQVMAKIDSFFNAAYMTITVSLERKNLDELDEKFKGVLRDYYQEDWQGPFVETYAPPMATGWL